MEYCTTTTEEGVGVGGGTGVGGGGGSSQEGAGVEVSGRSETKAFGRPTDAQGSLLQATLRWEDPARRELQRPAAVPRAGGPRP